MSGFIPMGGGADGAGASGVVGPASATDNAVVRFDLTTGKLVQNSSITIDDNGNLSATASTGNGNGVLRGIASGANGRGLQGEGNGSGSGVVGAGGTTGAGGQFTGGASGTGGAGVVCAAQGTAAHGITSTGSGTGAGGNFTGGATGEGIVVIADTTSPVRAAMLLTPQDAQPTGAHVVGHMYVTSAGVLKICTTAGTPGTWTSVGAQT